VFKLQPWQKFPDLLGVSRSGSILYFRTPSDGTARHNSFQRTESTHGSSTLLGPALHSHLEDQAVLFVLQIVNKIA
jgi:hypothetical protein